MRAFSTKVPLGAAARAAAMRSAASSMPNSPPLPASSMLAPTAPSSTARATVRPTSSAVSPYPASRSAVTGTLTAATMRPTCSSIVSRSSAPPSGTPQRPGDARAGRGDGREADLLEDAGGAGVPGVGEHEAGTGVQGEEGGGLVSSPVGTTP